jgi:hypothetical protein
MQNRYNEKRLRNIFLKRPEWMRSSDPISQIFKEKKDLLKSGSVCYAHIVQANSILFNLFPHTDHPAHIVYSTDPYIGENPDILEETAHAIYQYKDVHLDLVPEEWRELARVVTDERDRSGFTLTTERGGHTVKIDFLPTMIFRKLLPRRKLCGWLLPIITSPDCDSVMVLPKRYWTKEFKSAWIRGEI